MAKKRKSPKSKKHFRDRKPSHFRGRNPSNRPQRFKNDILRLLHDADSPLSLKDITAKLAEFRGERKGVEEELHSLLQQGIISKNGKKHFSLSPKMTLFEGSVEMNPKGFGFITNLCVSGGTTGKIPENDLFVPKHAMTGARQGDRVLVMAQKSRKKWQRDEAQILKVIHRGKSRIVGYYQKSREKHLVAPEDHRFPFQIDLGQNISPVPQRNDVVIVELIEEEQQNLANPKGQLVEILGPADSVDVQMRMVIEKFSLPHTFSDAALSEAADFPDSISSNELAKREDLRDVLHITIDGETAKDFDDAIFVEKVNDGYRLYVSIADVGHFVTPGSALDHEAYERGTSIYFPGRVIPMLPERLSNNLCSLVPGEDRLAFTAILDFSPHGKMVGKKFCKSVIRNHQRFTYTVVQKIIIDQDRTESDKHQQFLVSLEHARELAELLQKKRSARGSIGFNIPEPEIILDEKGNISQVNKSQRYFAHQLIEEFMLAANEAVAACFTETSTPSLYRIHEEPAPEKVEEFVDFAGTLGLPIPRGERDPAWFAEMLRSVKDTPKEYIFSTLLLRTMQQARYSPSNQGHFGLAATDYTHFTSPIRRYPDLLVHRCLEKLTKEPQQDGLPSKEQLTQTGTFLSERERAAIEAERDIHARLKLFFMERFIGESYDAIISGVTASALFIELFDPYVSGSIPLEQLQDDYYIYDQKNYRIVGDITFKIYQIGDMVRVQLVGVDRGRKRLHFAIVEKIETQEQ